MEVRDSSSFAYIYRILLFPLLILSVYYSNHTRTQRDQQHAQEADELLADDSFHGSIAKRISNKLSRKKTVSETEFVKTTGYALA